MVALVERAATAPAVPLPRSSFTALVVAESAQRRAAFCTRLRSLGARDLIEAASGAEARVRGAANGARDLVVVESGLPDGPALPLLADLRRPRLAPRGAAHRPRRPLRGTGRDRRRRPRLPRHPRPRAPAGAGADPARGCGRVPAAPPTSSPAARSRSLQLVAEGSSNKEIGEELGLSALTVKSHLARIARKLGTGDRAEMVALAMRSGRRPADVRPPARHAGRSLAGVITRARHAAGPATRRRLPRTAPRCCAAAGACRRSSPTAPALADAADRLAAGTRPGRRRRRARRRAPVRAARLPGPAAPRRLRDRARRPDRDHRPRRPAAPRCPARSGCCTPPARTCPACARSASRPTALRHRAGRAACSASPGSGSAPLVEQVLGLCPGEGALRRRLVHPTAARAMAALRRARRRGARRAARPAGRPAARSREARLGASRSSRHRGRLRRAAAAGGPVASDLRHAPAARAAASSRSVRALWYARDQSRAARDISPGRILPGRRDRGGRRRARRDRRRAGRAARLHRPRRAPPPAHLAGRGRGGPRAAGRRPARARPRPRTARRRRGPGATATRRPPPGWPAARAALAAVAEQVQMPTGERARTRRGQADLLGPDPRPRTSQPGSPRSGPGPGRSGSPPTGSVPGSTRAPPLTLRPDR